MAASGQIAIIGFKGCGKSTIGRMLAEKLDLAFQDTDEILENMYQRKTGDALSFREIYVRHGRGYFEELEAEAVGQALGGEGKVISFGGGSLITVDAKSMDVGRTKFVYLTAQANVLFDRIVAQGIPAFFSTNDPRASFEQLLEKRRPIYEKYATITIDNSYTSPEDTVRELEAELKSKGLI